MQVKPILFFLIVGSLAGIIIWKESRNPNMSVAIGADAPDFAIRDIDGKEVRLSDHRGKVVFLNFWGTWCLPCIEEMPDMEVMYKALEGRPFAMMAVTLDPSWDAVKEFYETYNLSLPSYLDPGRQVSSLYRISGQPETFIISPAGKILKHYIGPDRSMFAYVETQMPDQNAATQ